MRPLLAGIGQVPAREAKRGVVAAAAGGENATLACGVPEVGLRSVSAVIGVIPPSCMVMVVSLRLLYFMVSQLLSTLALLEVGGSAGLTPLPSGWRSVSQSGRARIGGRGMTQLPRRA